MFVKKFEAPSLEEALQQIKRELGPNALILSTEQKKGAFFQKALVEVTAATEKKARGPSDDGFDEREVQRVFPHRKDRGSERQASPVAGVINKYAAVDAEEASNRESRKPSSSSLQAERYEASFVDLGFAPESAREFARRLVFDYSRKDLSHASFLQKARVKLVAGQLRTLTSEQVAAKDAWVAVGLPGSGKTSLLVKLALHLKGKKRQCGLVSCDSRKLAGRQELLGYSRLVKVGFSAETPASPGGKLTLVDSPSLSFHNEEENGELEKICSRRDVVLVLDASMRLSELLRVAEHARRFGPVAIAFTRLDLVANYGVIYDVLKAARLPLLGLSLSRSFTTPFKFFEPAELAAFLLSSR